MVKVGFMSKFYCFLLKAFYCISGYICLYGKMSNKNINYFHSLEYNYEMTLSCIGQN